MVRSCHISFGRKEIRGFWPYIIDSKPAAVNGHQSGSTAVQCVVDLCRDLVFNKDPGYCANTYLTLGTLPTSVVVSSLVSSTSHGRVHMMGLQLSYL